MTSLIAGQIYSVNPAINPGGRSIQVKVRTVTGTEQLRDGTFVTCFVIVKEKQDAVQVPANVLVYRQNQPYVFVVTGDVVNRQQVAEAMQGMRCRACDSWNSAQESTRAIASSRMAATGWSTERALRSQVASESRR